MLRRFSVENYRNFNKKVELDLTKVRNYAYNAECVKDNVLNTALIIGKNGCGKTDLGLALFDIVRTLTDGVFDTCSNDINGFLNGFSKKGYAIFRYEFQSESDVIRYEYRKTEPGTIIYESLHVCDDLIFCRDGIDGIEDYRGLKGYCAENLRIEIQNGPLSVLRYIVNNTVQPADSPLSYIMDYAKHMLYFGSSGTITVIGAIKGSVNAESFIIQNELVDDFQKFLYDFAGLDVELGAIRIDGMYDMLVQKAGERTLIFSEAASMGTRSLVSLYYWMKHFGEVRFLYMDGFDVFYDHKLSENILRMIRSQGEVQAILTSHSTSLISNALLRPDCYLILNEGNLRSFSDSTEMEIRLGHNLEKLYRGGEFDE